MKKILIPCFIFVLNACVPVDQSQIITTEFSIHQDDTIKILKIDIRNHSNKDIYFVNLTQMPFFFSLSGTDISDSITYNTIRYYVPPSLISHYYRENFYKYNEYDLLQFKICDGYDSLIKYKNTDIGNILFNACNIEYKNFLMDNGLSSLDDSITIKDIFLMRYSNAVFIRRHSTYTRCYNLQYLFDAKIPVKILYRISQDLKEGKEYIKLINAQDSFVFRKNYLNDINEFKLLRKNFVSDTFYFNPDNLPMTVRKRTQ